MLLYQDEWQNGAEGTRQIASETSGKRSLVILYGKIARGRKLEGATVY